MFKKKFAKRKPNNQTLVRLSSFAGLPDRLQIRLPYQTIEYIGGDTAGVAKPLVQFRLNSIWDPEVTGRGLTVSGYADFVPMYDRYRVLACKYMVSMQQREANIAAAAGVGQDVLAWVRVGDAAGTNLADFGAATEWSLYNSRAISLPRGLSLTPSALQSEPVWSWDIKGLGRASAAGAPASFVASPGNGQNQSIAYFKGYHKMGYSDPESGPLESGLMGMYAAPAEPHAYTSRLGDNPTDMVYMAVGATPRDWGASGNGGPTITTPTVPFILVRFRAVYYVEFYSPLGVRKGNATDEEGLTTDETTTYPQLTTDPTVTLGDGPYGGTDPSP